MYCTLNIVVSNQKSYLKVNWIEKLKIMKLLLIEKRVIPKNTLHIPNSYQIIKVSLLNLVKIMKENNMTSLELFESVM